MAATTVLGKRTMHCPAHTLVSSRGLPAHIALDSFWTILFFSHFHERWTCERPSREGEKGVVTDVDNIGETATAESGRRPSLSLAERVPM